jgi:hypothetical protein
MSQYPIDFADYEVTTAHLFHREVLQFFASYVGLFYSMGKDALKAPHMVVHVDNACLRLEDIGEVARFLRGEVSAPPEPLRFSTAPQFLFGHELAQVPEDAAPRVSQALSMFLIGFAYESHGRALKAKLGKDPLRWPRELQLLRHVRNACFHGARFNITPRSDGTEPIDPDNTPAWSALELRSREKWHDCPLIPDFMSQAHVLPLLHDMGPAIQRALGLPVTA